MRRGAGKPAWEFSVRCELPPALPTPHPPHLFVGRREGEWAWCCFSPSQGCWYACPFWCLFPPQTQVGPVNLSFSLNACRAAWSRAHHCPRCEPPWFMHRAFCVNITGISLFSFELLHKHQILRVLWKDSCSLSYLVKEKEFSQGVQWIRGFPHENVVPC